MPKNVIFQDIVTETKIGEGILKSLLYTLGSFNQARIAQNY